MLSHSSQIAISHQLKRIKATNGKELINLEDYRAKEIFLKVSINCTKQSMSIPIGQIPVMQFAIEQCCTESKSHFNFTYTIFKNNSGNNGSTIGQTLQKKVVHMKCPNSSANKRKRLLLFFCMKRRYNNRGTVDGGDVGVQIIFAECLRGYSQRSQVIGMGVGLIILAMIFVGFGVSIYFE
ncbi:hypothetical protein SNEBB_003456 [Seison nebaliae]|nr:hypothetical protein SNEBB_003456 [Seison nebaliae]